MRKQNQIIILGLMSAVVTLTEGCSGGAEFSGSSMRQKKVNTDVEQGGDAHGAQKLETPAPTPVQPSDFSLALQYKDSSDPLKLVLIVDDSSSMVPKQQQLAKGLDIALEAVKGKNVSVYLYSSSIFAAFYGSKFFYGGYLNSYALTQFPLPASANEKYYATWMGMYYSDILSKTAKPSLEILPRVKKNGSWITPATSAIDFVPEEAETRFVINRSAFNSVDGALQFTDSMTAEQFAAMKAKLKQEIIIGDLGNSEEMPLCTLAALLQNDGPNKIFGQGDRAAFVIISDEDQTTALRPCPYAHKVTSMAVNPGPYTAGVALGASVVMDYKAKCDSTALDGYCGNQPFLIRSHTDCKTNPLCQNVKQETWAPCSAEQRADYLEFFKKNYANELASGKYKISDSDTCQVILAGDTNKTGQARIATSWTNPDPRPFVVSGKSYASVVAYFEALFPNDNMASLPKIWGAYGVPTGGFVNIDGVTKAEDLPGVLRKKATDLFGQGNFTISVIGNTGNAAASGCSVDPASESKILFNIADTKASVCDADYSKGLSWLEGFGFKKLVSSYKISSEYLTDDFNLFIASNGKEALLTPDQYSYDVATEILTLKLSLPYANDSQILARKK